MQYKVYEPVSTYNILPLKKLPNNAGNGSKPKIQKQKSVLNSPSPSTKRGLYASSRQSSLNILDSGVLSSLDASISSTERSSIQSPTTPGVNSLQFPENSTISSSTPDFVRQSSEVRPTSAHLFSQCGFASLAEFTPVSSLASPTAASEGSTLSSTLHDLPTSFTHSLTQTFSVAHYVNDTHQLSTSQQRSRVIDYLHKDLSHRTNEDIHFIAKFLLTVDIFSQLSLEICSELARIAKIKRFNREEVIFREGDDILVIYIILAGSVGTRMDSLKSASSEMSGSGYIAGVQSPGNSLDVVLSSLFSSDIPRRTSTRMAIERTELMVIDVTQYKLILKSVENENEKEKIKFLINLPLFDLCSPAEIKSIAHVMKKVTIRKNSLLFSQDEKSDAVYFLTHGSCRVLRRVVNPPCEGSPKETYSLYEVATLVPPAFVGELGVINSSKRTCSVYAENVVTVYQITREDFLSSIPRFLLAYFDEYAKMFYINNEGKNTWEKRCVGYPRNGIMASKKGLELS